MFEHPGGTQPTGTVDVKIRRSAVDIIDLIFTFPDGIQTESVNLIEKQDRPNASTKADAGKSARERCAVSRLFNELAGDGLKVTILLWPCQC
ncbi:hypothetical protein MAR_004291 [Mya arenaria]|uniref:Uncharacterized protein n=1 Tax=Mya arenaria TaxID=6604 RepID=A0ABY7F4D0_MYAAR|nr:hypothetical protein MAR_004291 [Mya arenaria]